jgi:hypothetical protein
MSKASRKAMRKATSADIINRFPKGGNDPLGSTMTLGNAFRSVNSLDFKLVKTGTMLPRK